MQLRLDQHSPIYQQIIDEFKRAIARGELKPGDRIPSQRELASMVQVNPNTVQRAYREMEQLGITETLRGQGTFVTQDAGLVDSVRREMAERALVSFVQEMNALGYGCEEMVELVRETYRRVLAAQGGESDGDGGV
ncbi:MAG: GntR family transcriptional regulator [Clostridia bacterium]|nr:GntR family transcriptional regulator [Bacillota bacterium]MBO2521430.1 GntR family transcriptional regulator [Bacillota bacterium]